ncbi:DNA-3-methyladenine glycosylase [Acetohalobium arabaticum]|uniref:Putative 3-methyladenine DNA glycosylase n=1 Tax=Acetohalobium arabaticum (strain ATCC 49924 / DSM 5501 / Z-7288) TaxID=574087 RepID=D9QQ12_ACEAZ|nr:DNA-3-methyladenine glycosylase [Acetohalobium arabaticum]ADL12603.1 DNA-3-methyladenine glycosylase [Acetohalobium arabaticum DSM 5501]
MNLKLDFYKQDAVTLAKNLLGNLLIRRIKDKEIRVKIVETEAYVGPEDKACHAYQNKKTKRTKVMFKRGGHSYVYLIYGIHHCFNVVTASKGKPEAVLVRAVEPIEGWDLIRQNRQIKSNKDEDLTNGPGKLCQALEIDKSLNGHDLVKGEKICIADNNQSYNIAADKRINIDYAEEYKDKLWRFYIKDNSFVSK